MSGSVGVQVDVSSLSLAGLNTFSTILDALSADDVQPIAMLQLEKLGAVFPISGPLRTIIPDHLQRCKNTRLERLGLCIGWKKGDAASLMSQSAGGQAVALLATCLENIYGNDATANIFYKLSKSLLPNSVRLSSPKQLSQATGILSRKAGTIGFGTLLAKHVCRIHDVYGQLGRLAPTSLLASLSQEGMDNILSKFSQALREEKCLVRVRGCASMGYIFALAVSLFSDDCMVTVENLIIHKGCRSSAITVEITESSGNRSLQVQLMGIIESVSEIPVRLSQLSPSMKFAYKGHFAEYTRLRLQEMGLMCVPDALVAMGTCILSLSDLIYVSVDDVPHTNEKGTVNLFSQVFGESPRAALHQRCQEAFEVTLPLKWPSLKESLAQLEHILARSNQAETFSQLSNHSGLYADPSDLLLRIIDAGAASLLVTSREQDGVWQERSNHRTWRPCEIILGRGSKHVIVTPSKLLRQLLSWDDTRLIAKSEGGTTLFPAGILYLGREICHYRGLEIMDGLIFHKNVYHDKVISGVDADGPRVPSEVSLTIAEDVHGLVLECTVIYSGLRQSINLRERVDQLFGLLDTYACNHSRKTPLNREYVSKVQINSVLTPDGRSGEQISIVQTYGNPTAQFVALTKWEPAILCRRCCLNCAYEQARKKEIYKIIVA
ncbi:uncharacterized protein N7482_003987 [Penicillium canariense]|uniref:Uncharacterized protein n=1 Tax=Penicillium canariense TaxID=189055 RepID=A0A9W9I7S2_9EURO|nr:uncharacterized protein N7482_003987 [Penicillium canariense]KAJ5168393.1 hypothetical protein N7482_003987 [Penicillium canariense]